jgi:hypothetical protein
VVTTRTAGGPLCHEPFPCHAAPAGGIVAAAIMSDLVHLTLISHPDAVAEVISAAIGSWH